MNNWRILVVEDDPDGQEVVATILQHLNLGLDTAYDAEQAMDFLYRSGMSYDAVVVDLALPGMDGWDLLREIQNHGSTANLTCIAVTAFHSSKLREEALSAGFTAYFPKPIDATSFIRELETLLA